MAYGEGFSTLKGLTPQTENIKKIQFLHLFSLILGNIDIYIYIYIYIYVTHAIYI